MWSTGKKAAEAAKAPAAAAAWRCLSFYALCFNTLPQHNAAKSAKNNKKSCGKKQMLPSCQLSNRKG